MHERSSLVVSLVAFDGYPFETAVRTLAAIGVRRIEPALIAGYTDPFDETVFTDERARRMRIAAQAAGITCAAFSAHVDVGAPDGFDRVRRRLQFAAELGATRLVTNAARKEYRDRFFGTIERLIPEAQRSGVKIALENPGDGRSNLMDSAGDATELVARIDSPWVTVNYDPGNLVTHRPELEPEQDALALGARTGSLHLKDTARVDGRVRFVPLATGMIDYAKILAHTDTLAPPPEYSIEIPLRLARAPGGKPDRDPQPAPLDRIRAVVTRSLEWIESL